MRSRNPQNSKESPNKGALSISAHWSIGPFLRQTMATPEQEERLKQAFDDFRTVVADTEGWEFLIERRDVNVHWKNYPNDSISTFRGVGVVAKARCNPAAALAQVKGEGAEEELCEGHRRCRSV